MTQEISVWDDTPETEKPDSTTTKDSVETDPKPLSAAVEADSPATDEPAQDLGADAGVDSGDSTPEAVASAEPPIETASGAPVFDPEAPHVTHVSTAGHHHLQGGHLFSTGTKAHVGSLQEIQ